MANIKCPECNERIENREDLFLHIETDHAELLPKGFSGARYIFLKNHGRDYSPCSECGKNTPWNEATQKPHKYCSKRCKKLYRKKFEGNMIGTYNKICLLNDRDQQIKMLQARKISGLYTWSSGEKIDYTGSYEKDFLQFIDIVLQFEPLDVFSPAPQTFYYEYEGKKLFYIPDYYIASINTIVEIKSGGDHPNNHPKIQQVDKVKERLKDEVMKTQTQYNYIKITNKEYGKFVDFLITLKNQTFEDVSEKAPPVIIREQLNAISEQLTSEASNLYILMYNNGMFSEYATMYDMELDHINTIDENGNIVESTYDNLIEKSFKYDNIGLYLFKYIKPLNRISISEKFNNSEEYIKHILHEAGVTVDISVLIEDTNLLVPMLDETESASEIDTIINLSEKYTKMYLNNKILSKFKKINKLI